MAVSRNRINIIVVWVFIIVFYQTNCLPVVDIDTRTYAFLRNKGYLDTSSVTPGASQLQSQQGIIDAIKRFQNFAGIRESGKIDDLTKEYMVKPRCGMPDMKNGKVKKRVRRYNHQGSYWKDTSQLTWALENSNNDGITDYQVRRILTQAFQKWEDKTNIHFRELYRQPENTALIRVRFERLRHGDPYPFDGYGGTLAHAFYPLNNKGLAGDVHFDDDEVYTLKTIAKRNERKLLWIAVHEIGHSIGLEHSPTTGAIMWPYYQNFNTDDFDLTYDDILGIQTLYGGKIRTTRSGGRKTRAPITTARPGGDPKTRAPVTTARTVVTKAPVTLVPTVKASSTPTRRECTDQMKAAFIGVNRKLYFFNHDKLYMLYDQNKIGVEEGPKPPQKHFYGLKSNKVDAVFKDPYYRTHFVFHGDTFSIFNCWTKYCKIRRDGQPRKIEYGFQNIKPKLDRIDAALIWPSDTKVLFIFKGEQYWKLKRKTFATYIAEYGYPKNIKATWHGLPATIDTAFQWTNKKIYFTKGKFYYRWDERRQSVRRGYPVELTKSFLNCYPDKK